MHNFSETDLCPPIRDYFTARGYIVRSEVGACDMTATKGDELIVVELKRGLTVDLLIQATERQRLTQDVYIAIPVPRRVSRRDRMGKTWRGREHLLKRLGLGLILVPLGTGTTVPSEIDVVFPPGDESQPRRKYALRRTILKEAAARSHDYNSGGSTKRKIVTAYREEAIYLSCCLETLPNATPAVLRKMGAGEKSQAILHNNHYGWFLKVRRGVYALAPGAITEIESKYAPLAAACRARMDANRTAAYNAPTEESPSETL